MPVSVLESKWCHTGKSHAFSHNSAQRSDIREHSIVNRILRSGFSLSFLTFERVYNFIRFTLKGFGSLNAITYNFTSVYNRKTIRCLRPADLWGMKFNANKCYILSTHQKSNFFYELNNTILQQVNANPYLGLTLSEILTRDTHIKTFVRELIQLLDS